MVATCSKVPTPNPWAVATKDVETWKCTGDAGLQLRDGVSFVLLRDGVSGTLLGYLT